MVFLFVFCFLVQTCSSVYVVALGSCSPFPQQLFKPVHLTLLGQALAVVLPRLLCCLVLRLWEEVRALSAAAALERAFSLSFLWFLVVFLRAGLKQHLFVCWVWFVFLSMPSCQIGIEEASREGVDLKGKLLIPAGFTATVLTENYSEQE